MKIFSFFFFFTPSGFSKKVLFFLVPPQVLARFYCQSLRRYQKKQKILPKPEEVPKKNKKSKDLPIFSPGCLQDMKIFFFFVPPQVLAKKFWFFFGTSSGFGTILLPKPEEVPQENKKNMAKT